MQPFSTFKDNPSWLAVRKLHNTLLDLEAEPLELKVNLVVSERGPFVDGIPKLELGEGGKGRFIHITTLQVPTAYSAVLSIVPKLHARPPVLPDPQPLESMPTIPPPEDGYDLIFHVGVAGPGDFRLELLGHRFGYQLPDAEGKYAPLLGGTDESIDQKVMQALKERRESEASKREEERVGVRSRDFPARAPRGFGKGYEAFESELFTSIDVPGIVWALNSMDMVRVFR